MGKVVKNSDGSYEYVEDAALGDRTVAGPQTYTTAAGAQVTLTPEEYAQSIGNNPLARRDTVAAEDVAGQVLQKEKEDKYGGFIEGTKAFTEGVISAGSFGFSDPLLNELTDGGTQARAEVNKGRIGGEIVGTIASIVGTGGTGALAKVPAAAVSGAIAKTAAKKLGTGFTARVAAETAEGAAFGAGQAVSNLTFSNEPLTAEAVFSELAKQGLYGAGFGAAGGAIGYGLGKGASKLESHIAAKAAEKEADGVYDAISRLSKEEQTQLTDSLGGLFESQKAALAAAEDTILKARAPVEGFAFTFGRSFDDSARLIDDASTLVGPKAAAAELKAAAKAHKGLENLYGKDVWKRPGVLNTDVIARYPEKAEAGMKFLDDYRNAALGVNKKAGFDVPALVDHKTIRGKVADTVDLPAMKASVKALEESSQNLQKAWGKGGLDPDNLAAFLSKDKDNALQTLSALDSHVKQLDGFIKQYGDAGPVTARYEQAREKLTEGLKLLLKDSPAAAQGIKGTELVAALGLAEAVPLPDFEGPADDLLKIWLVHKAMGGKLMPKAVSKAASGLMKYAKFKAAQTVTNNVISRVVQNSHGMNYILGGIMGRIASGSKALGDVGDVASRAGVAAAKGVARASRFAAGTSLAVLNSTSFGDEEPKKESNIYKAFEARRQELKEIVSNPLPYQTKLNEALGGIRQINLGVGDKLEMKAMEVAQYLHDSMPKDPGTMRRLTKSTWKPTEAEIHEFSMRMRGAIDPMGVFEDLVAGKAVSPVAAEAVRTLHPETFAEIQRAIFENLPELQDKMSYDRVINLGIFYGVETDPAMGAKDFMQDHYAKMQESEGNQPIDLQQKTKPEPQTTGDLLQGR